MLEIKLENLSFSYGKNLPNVINKLKFTFSAGNTYLVSGSNGSGKSTLLKLISKIIDNDSVSYSDFNDFVAPTCSYFNQNLGLYEELTVIENINFYQSLLKKNYSYYTDELIEKFSLKKLLNKKIYELSSGQKVKTSLLLKLFFKPKVLLLDEPLNNLDKDSRVILIEIILKLKDEHEDDFIFIFVDHLEMFSNIANQELKL